jgi:hypothetical protein
VTKERKKGLVKGVFCLFVGLRTLFLSPLVGSLSSPAAVLCCVALWFVVRSLRSRRPPGLLVFPCRSCYNKCVGLVLPVLSSVFSRFSSFGFSGSRSGVSPAVLSSVVGLVPPGSGVFVGCAAGVDRFFRGAFPSAVVFSVSSGRWGRGRGAFAGRSAACVRAVSAAGGLWVAFPSGDCPAGLLPAGSSSRAFCGSGSGSWASLAFALGSGVPCLVFAPAGVPAGWGFSSVPGCPGWFGCPVALGSAPVQLSLF